MKGKVVASTLCSVLLAVAWSSPATAGDEGAKIGRPAPQFNLPDTNGKIHNLADYTKDGKIIVLEWCNHECPVWKKHTEQKNTIKLVKNKAYQDKVVFFGVDSAYKHEGKESDINADNTKTGVNYTILMDPDGKIGKAYGAKTTPHLFVINADGMLVYNGAIDNQKEGDEHINYLQLALDQTLAGETVATSKIKPYGCSVKYKK